MDPVNNLRIDFKLSDNGWAKCSITTPDRHLEIDGFGYCTDAFGDLVRAALLIATGAREARVSFDGEPMEWRWIVEHAFFEPLLLKIAMLPDIYARAADAEGDLLFSMKCTPDVFATAVADATQRLLDEVGLDGFASRWWMVGFPLRGLRALQLALATTEAEPASMHPRTQGGWNIIDSQG